MILNNLTTEIIQDMDCCGSFDSINFHLSRYSWPMSHRPIRL